MKWKHGSGENQGFPAVWDNKYDHKESGGSLASCEHKLFSPKNAANPFVLFKLKGNWGRQGYYLDHRILKPPDLNIHHWSQTLSSLSSAWNKSHIDKFHSSGQQSWSYKMISKNSTRVKWAIIRHTPGAPQALPCSCRPSVVMGLDGESQIFLRC